MEWITRRALAARPPVLLGALLLAFATQRISQTILDGFYARSGYPVPYYVGQLSFSGEKLSGWYTTMQRAGTLGVYWQTQFVDFGFIAATALLFTALLLVVARALPAGTRARAIAICVVPFGLVAPAFDALENLLSFALLQDPSSVSQPLALAYSTAAALKFAGFAAVYLWTTAGLITAAVLRLRRRSTRPEPSTTR
ncbi:hypothetical protein Cs7R123_46740 [Catellatospora sp. TT07R-123]|uniref:hypothetical protein n=1 Tax=Catellatospora sp. TT07R-123 TaxID=2733863 RepID=UPI001B1595A3|nr:hypothetical protein [Catellatospora sp. TT07R-123]GHJ47332.1 hypothetical protein Cs7R123_46740 [Catellatospora sp. TT07R-123]